MVLVSISLEELYSNVDRIVKSAIQSEIQGLKQPVQPVELLSRFEAAKLLGISLPTLNNYSQDGRLQSYKIGSRIRYKREEVLSALQKTKKFKRT
jgi:excisionase family DNA binding protein